MQQIDAIRRTQRKKGNASHLNLFGMFVFGALALGILNLLLLLGLFATLNRLSQKAPPSLVQTVDGRSIVTNAMEWLLQSSIIYLPNQHFLKNQVQWDGL